MENSTKPKNGRGNPLPDEPEFTFHSTDPSIDEILPKLGRQAFKNGFLGKPIQPVINVLGAKCDLCEANDSQKFESKMVNEEAKLEEQEWKRENTTKQQRIDKARGKLKPQYDKDIAEIDGNIAVLQHDLDQAEDKLASTSAEIDECENQTTPIGLLLAALLVLIAVFTGGFEGFNLSELFRATMDFPPLEAYTIGFFLALVTLASPKMYVLLTGEDRPLIANLSLITGIAIIVANLVLRIFHGDYAGIYISLGMAGAFILELGALQYLEVGKRARKLNRLKDKISDFIKETISGISIQKGLKASKKTELESDSKSKADKSSKKLDKAIDKSKKKIATYKKDLKQIERAYRLKKASAESWLKEKYERGVKKQKV